jgi:DNA uptake protein ComE-like DNA-binding protein
MTRSKFFTLFGVLVAVLLAMTPPSVAQTKPKPAAKSATAKTTAALVDINTASKSELTALPGIGDAFSQKIIDGRPYARKDQLLSKKIIPEATYDKIKDQIVAKQPKKS